MKIQKYDIFGNLISDVDSELINPSDEMDPFIDAMFNKPSEAKRMRIDKKETTAPVDIERKPLPSSPKESLGAARGEYNTKKNKAKIEADRIEADRKAIRKEKRRAYNAIPANQERDRAYRDAQYETLKEKRKVRNADPIRKEKLKAYRDDPVVKERAKKWREDNPVDVEERRRLNNEMHKSKQGDEVYKAKRKASNDLWLNNKRNQEIALREAIEVLEDYNVSVGAPENMIGKVYRKIPKSKLALAALTGGVGLAVQAAEEGFDAEVANEGENEQFRQMQLERIRGENIAKNPKMRDIYDQADEELRKYGPEGYELEPASDKPQFRKLRKNLR